MCMTNPGGAGAGLPSPSTDPVEMLTRRSTEMMSRSSSKQAGKQDENTKVNLYTPCLLFKLVCVKFENGQYSYYLDIRISKPECYQKCPTIVDYCYMLFRCLYRDKALPDIDCKCSPYCIK